MLLVVVAILQLGFAASARCLQYEPTTVSIQGKLTTRAVPGPPGYVSIARGDHPETNVIVVLDEPVCVLASTSNRLNAKTHAKVTEIQLVLQNTAYRHLVGKQVRATGTLFSAQTGHHRTPVVLTVKALRGI